ncbi:uncharacterized protein LOC108629165 [Ceratina calcarata]|uniref:Uncharacterized protein LOC108629165 n=1 Tax=Ceratina calcarata TaxID=156304 RepID=A0AAJ7J873_9HYME|nr:uncharacterized protein LOC108629165 [Ceratina calcarata]XP_017887133.1 uncharacterized protein LOC108629165 [Ceratina calcarata]
MALHRISNSSELLKALSRVSLTVNASLNEMQCTRHALLYQHRMKNLHVTSVRRYPDPPALPLPTNVSEIFANETGRFTPERARDIAAPVLLYSNNDRKSFYKTEQLTKPAECTSSLKNCNDTHVESYDCFGAVSLNGSMQSTVPKPFCSNGKSMYLNMPGGQWARDGKYIAEDMQKSHYRSIHLPQLKLNKSGLTSHVATNTLFQTMYTPKYICSTGFSTKTNHVLSSKEKVDAILLSRRERFKILMKEYGTTVVIFHIGISLVSLGACYAAVSSGIDLKPIINNIYVTSNQQIDSAINTSSTFLIAYSIHKLMAPIRISLTLAVTPFLVRYLRKIGFLKRPKKELLNEKKLSDKSMKLQ